MGTFMKLLTAKRICIYHSIDVHVYLGLNLKNSGIFSYGPSIPWFGMAVTNDVRPFISPPSPRDSIFSASLAVALFVKSTPLMEKCVYKN